MNDTRRMISAVVAALALAGLGTGLQPASAPATNSTSASEPVPAVEMLRIPQLGSEAVAEPAAPEEPEAAAEPADAPATNSADGPEQVAAAEMPQVSQDGSQPAAAPAPAPPVQVLDLSPEQTANARVIVQVAKDMGIDRRGMVIAIATTLQESRLRNLASTVYAESYNYPHQGEGSDHDSVGLFQQRPSSGWGTVPELMDPAYAARAFYNALLRVPDWSVLTYAAQRVQGSAFPDAYAKHEAYAAQIVDAVY